MTQQFLTTEEVSIALSISQRTLRDLVAQASPALRSDPRAPFEIGRGQIRRTLRWPVSGYAEWVRLASASERPAPSPPPSPLPPSIPAPRSIAPRRTRGDEAATPTPAKKRSLYDEAIRARKG